MDDEPGNGNGNGHGPALAKNGIDAIESCLTPASFAHVASRGVWKMPSHLELLNRKLLDVAAGRCRRLIITMPPRHGKSMFASQYFPAWYLGTFPMRKVILTSYEADFAAQWGRKAREALEEHGHVFGVRLNMRSNAAYRWEIDRHGGVMQTAGAGGPVTGKGADLFICDDPIKNAEEADSKVMRDKLWDWWNSTAYTRLEPNASVVVIQTRWHEDDLAGKLISEQAEQWEVLNLPAIAEENDALGRSPGEALWPTRWSLDALRKIKQNLPAKWWTSLYQQRPSAQEGDIFRSHTFKTFIEKDDIYEVDGDAFAIGDCWRFAAVDLAVSQRTTADYTVCCIVAVSPKGDLLVLDVHRDRLQAPDTRQLLKNVYANGEVDFIGVEKSGFQEAMIQELRREGVPVKPMSPRGDKVSRAKAASVRFDAGKVYFRKGAKWLRDLEMELLTFPNAAHDDQVDAIAYACLEVGRRYRLDVPAVEAERKAEMKTISDRINPGWS